MPVSKKKPTTPASEVSTPESSSPALPEQEEFRQYVRRLADSAVQVLIEHVMREERSSVLEHRGEKLRPIAVGIAMAPTPVM